MNKALHAIVYLILIAAIAALVLEKSLFDKRTLLGDRNREMEDYVVRLARTIEKADAPRPMSVPEAKKDVSPIEAAQLDSPEMENVLEEYPAQLETANLDTFNWDDANSRLQLRQLYFLQNGEVVPDVANHNKPMTKGKGTMAELLDQLLERAKAQQANLNNTRAQLAEIRGKLEASVAEYNKLKPELRLAKMTEDEFKQKISQLGQEKQVFEDQVTKLKSQLEEQSAEIASLKDEVSTAKDATAVAEEDSAAKQKKIDQLQKLMQQMAQQQNQATGSAGGAAGGTAVTSLPAGEKGKIADVNNNLMFCVVEFSEEAMKEMLGADRQRPLPAIELGIRRKGFKGPAGEFVGKIRLRQSVSGKNFVIADVLGDWSQVAAAKGDVIFAD
jgi:septal ring factor EnvC (AmiA/AmiB activator)